MNRVTVLLPATVLVAVFLLPVHSVAWAKQSDTDRSKERERRELRDGGNVWNEDGDREGGNDRNRGGTRDWGRGTVLGIGADRGNGQDSGEGPEVVRERDEKREKDWLREREKEREKERERNKGRDERKGTGRDKQRDYDPDSDDDRDSGDDRDRDRDRRYRYRRYYFREYDPYDPVYSPSGGSSFSATSHATTRDLSATTHGSMGSSDSTLRKGKSAQISRQERFIAVSLYNVYRDMARGGGAHLQSLSLLLGCPASVYPQFAELTRREFERLLPDRETEEEGLLERLKSHISDNPLLSRSCEFV